MATLEIQGKTFEVDGDGFLTDPSIWNEDVAKLFAEADGITELNDKHWAIIKIIRDNFEEKGNAPMVRTICKETGLKLKDIYELFPLGPARGACRVAGLPKPDRVRLIPTTMSWYIWTSLAALLFCVVLLGGYFVRLLKHGSPKVHFAKVREYRPKQSVTLVLELCHLCKKNQHTYTCPLTRQVYFFI